MSILHVKRSKRKYFVLHNGMITWNSLPDVVKSQRIIFDVREQGTKFLSRKIL